MKVVARQVGFDGNTVREVGDEFDVPDSVVVDTTGQLWFEPVDARLKAKYGSRADELDSLGVNPARQTAARDAEVMRMAEVQGSERRAPRSSAPVQLKV